jgi:hypothetical protein
MERRRSEKSSPNQMVEKQNQKGTSSTRQEETEKGEQPKNKKNERKMDGRK